MCWHDSLPCISPPPITYIFLCKIFTQEHILAEQGAVKGINICSILMKKHRLPLRSGKPDMAADQANQMGIQITQGGGVDQVQGIHDLPQTTQTFLIESRHHLHQAKETGVSLIFYQVHQINCVVFACQIFFFARHIALRDPSPTLFDDFGFDSNSPSPPMDHTPVSSRERLQETASHSARRGQREGSAGKKLSKFCHECGTKYPVENAKFCCECGMRRLYIDLT